MSLDNNETINPTLALCIPAYNAAWCLPRLLASAAAQTVPFDEIIVYDDCSTDDTSAVAEAHGAHVIRGSINAGCSYGKSRMAEATKCDWVHFHDADDDILPFLSERARLWMNMTNGPEVVLLHYEYRDAETGQLIGEPSYDQKLMQDDPLRLALTHLIPNFGLYHLESFRRAGGFDLDPSTLYNEDTALHLRLALAGLRFGYDPETTCINYRYGSSMSQGGGEKCTRSQYHVMRKAAELTTPEYHSAIAERLWKIAGEASSYKSWEVADKAALTARSLGLSAPRGGTRAFALAARISPRLALRGREYAIRLLRPQLRQEAQHHPPFD